MLLNSYLGSYYSLLTILLPKHRYTNTVKMQDYTWYSTSEYFTEHIVIMRHHYFAPYVIVYGTISWTVHSTLYVVVSYSCDPYTIRWPIKGKRMDLYSAFIVVRANTQGAQVRNAQFYLQITPYLPLTRMRSPDGASSDWGCGRSSTPPPAHTPTS